MKFPIGVHAYIWFDEGNGIYDGTRGEIIAWRSRKDIIEYRFDNLGSDDPIWVEEQYLKSEKEWQSIAQRMLNGDLSDSWVARKQNNPKYRSYFRLYRRQYATGETK